MTEPWFTTRMGAFDLETSGTDPHEAFIVTAHLSMVGGGTDTVPADWVLSPGDLEIPEGAAKIHGYDTARARAEGVDHRKGLEEIVQAVANVVSFGHPLVGHNIGQYDLTLLDAECRRWDVAPVLDRTDTATIWPVIDTMVIDKHVAPFRRRVSETQGPYTLRTSAETYGIGWNEASAHGARYDAMASARVAWLMGRIAHTPHDQRPDWVRRLRTQYFDDLADVYLDELHNRQMLWADEQARSLQEWLRKSDPDAVVDGTWPVRKAVTS